MNGGVSNGCVRRGESQAVFKWITISTLVILLIGYLLASRDYGMGWDELRRWNGGDVKLQYYQDWFAYLGGFRELPPHALSDRYPGFFDMTLALLRAMIPIDPMMLGHAYSAFWGWLGVVAVAGISRLLVGWRLALIAVLLLGLAPVYIGHAGHNPKDIPFAAAYAWGLFGLLWINQRFSALRYRDMVLCGLLFGVAASVRLAGGILPVFLACLLFGRWVLMIGTMPVRSRVQWSRMYLYGFLLCCLLLVCVLFPFWPAMHKHPLGITSQVLGQLHDLHSVASTKYVHFMGQFHEAGALPWFALPWLVLIKIPEIWLLGLLGAIGGFVAYLRQDFTGKDRDVNFIFGTAIIVVAVFFPLAYVIITAAQVHGGIRHVLFLLPPLALLAALGLNAIAAYLWQKVACGKLLTGVFLGGACFLLLVTNFRMHPLQYVYFNALVGGSSGAYGKYELDYWLLAHRQALEARDAWAPRQNGRRWRIYAGGLKDVLQYQLPDDMEFVHSNQHPDFIIATTTMLAHQQIGLESVYVVERMGVPLCVVYEVPDFSGGATTDDE